MHVEKLEIACNLQLNPHLTDYHFSFHPFQYLFWSGRIAIGNTIGALIPLDLIERFTYAVENASIALKPAFTQDVTM
jgi:hypothetical protein